MTMEKTETKRVEASKVRKGDLIALDGPKRVTRRQKYNDGHYRIYYTALGPTATLYPSGYSYVPGNFSFVVYQGEDCKLCGKKYMPQFSCYEGFCGYGCHASHAFVTS